MEVRWFHSLGQQPPTAVLLLTVPSASLRKGSSSPPLVSCAGLNLTGMLVGCHFLNYFFKEYAIFSLPRQNMSMSSCVCMCSHKARRLEWSLKSTVRSMLLRFTLCAVAELCNTFASAAGPPGGDSRELHQLLSFVSAFLIRFFFLVFLFGLPLRSRCLKVHHIACDLHSV